VQQIIRSESAFDRGLFRRVTTNQVLCVARKLEGQKWTTMDIATHLAVNEQQVRGAVSWLVKHRLLRVDGREWRNLPSKYCGAKYEVKIYTITDAGMVHGFVTAHRESAIGHYGNVAALEMALGFCVSAEKQKQP
jgi:hypothetical protein